VLRNKICQCNSGFNHILKFSQSPQLLLKVKTEFLFPQEERWSRGLLFKLRSALSTGHRRSGAGWTDLSCPHRPPSPWVTTALGLGPLPFEALKTFGGDIGCPWEAPPQCDPNRIQLPCPLCYFQPLSLSRLILRKWIYEARTLQKKRFFSKPNMV